MKEPDATALLEREIHTYAMLKSIRFDSAALILILLELRTLNSNINQGTKLDVKPQRKI